jgi:predicted dehydrogenase
LLATDGAEARGIVEDAPVADVFAGHFGLERRTLNEVLGDDAVDAVLVHSKSEEMTPLAVAAMEAGKDVLVEKPGGRSLEDLRQLAQVAEATGRICQVGYNARASQAVSRSWEVLDSGALGDVLQVRFHASCSLGEAATPHINGPGEIGGAFWVIGSHVIDLALTRFGLPDSINARLPKFDGFKDPGFREDAASVTFSYDRCLVSIDFMSWDALPWIESWTMTAYGTNGDLTTRVLPAEVTTRLAEPAGGMPTGIQRWSQTEYPVAWAGKISDYSPELAEIVNTELLGTEVDSFLEKVRGGNPSGAVMSTARDALNVAEVVTACYRSSDQDGAPVSLEEVLEETAR